VVVKAYTLIIKQVSHTILVNREVVAWQLAFWIVFDQASVGVQCTMYKHICKVADNFSNNFKVSIVLHLDHQSKCDNRNELRLHVYSCKLINYHLIFISSF